MMIKDRRTMSDLCNPLSDTEPIRSDTYCTECSKNFISEIDVRVNGNHIIICPYCGHEHCRLVEGGTITSDRWDSRNSTKTTFSKVWKSNNFPIQTSTAAQFLRDKWLNRSDINLGA
jgi:hypothetical protein